ncbi:uncharacterized protein LOC144170810 [Haemaphysalis longicornis]
MPTCSAPGCRSGYASTAAGSVQRHFFKPPKDPDVLKAWENTIPRKNFKVTSKTYVCDIHFEPADIVSSYEHVVNGQTVRIPRGRWTLRESAVPRIFPNLPDHLSKPKAPKAARKPPKVRTVVPAQVASCQNDGLSCDQTEPSDGMDDVQSTEVSTLETVPWLAFMQGLGKCPTFEYWNVKASPTQVIFYKLEESGGIVLTEKAVVVGQDLSVEVSSRGVLVPPRSYSDENGNVHSRLTSLKNVAAFLRCIDALNICTGCKCDLFPGISSATTAMKKQGAWHKNKCMVLSNESLCPPCKKTKKNLENRVKRRPRKSTKRKPQCEVRNLRRRAIRATVFRERAKKELNTLRCRLAEVSVSEVDKALANLPEAQQLAFRAALKVAKAKSARGRRYEHEWLMTCLLLRISSPRAYRLMSKMKLLPLPTTTRLRQMMKGMPCEFGFNKVSLASVGAFMKGKTGVQCYGTLVLDEMKVREVVSFNKSTYKVDGFVDYGDGQDSETTADHALVLMFVPLFHSWVQPIASFATRHAAPGRVLAKLVLEAIMELYKHNAVVVAVISDGASTNKAMWSSFGIKGKLDAPKHKVEHPCAPDQHLYFLCDVPHIIKCIRNHLLRHKYAMIGQHKVNFDHYRKLQEVDGKQQLRVVPKLTKEHVSPDNLRKMNVRLAVQLFSRSTAIGLKVYQRLKEPGLQDGHGTAEWVNNVFDALNVKLPQFGITSSSKEIEVIKKFLDAVNETEESHVTKGTVMFASQVTMESLRVTLASVRDLIGDLLSKGARFVLTGKLNQDPLERFFGVTRSYGGDEDHPTLISFSHIYRLLSLYTPISTCVTGNVKEEHTFVLATVADSMKRGQKDRLSSYESLQETVGAKLSEICATAQDSTLTAPDHGYSTPTAQDCVIYYLCGYLVHSFLKHEKCSDCIRSIQSENAEVPEAFLTLERSFKEGSLKLPSWELFCMFRGIEHKVSDQLQRNRLCSDTFWTLLDALRDCDVTSVGCPVHKDTTTAELLRLYIVLRMHFAAKDVCKSLSSSEKVASARKKAKLL